MSKRRWRVGQCAMVAQREPRTLISDFSALRSAVVTGVLSVLLIVGFLPVSNGLMREIKKKKPQVEIQILKRFSFHVGRVFLFSFQDEKLP